MDDAAKVNSYIPKLNGESPFGDKTDTRKKIQRCSAFPIDLPDIVP